jgi:hypothetical protein
MKTAEEIVTKGCGYIAVTLTIPELKQIQLDAMKEGMRRAANKISSCPSACECSQSIGWREAEQQILTAAEQLTEKDL